MSRVWQIENFHLSLPGPARTHLMNILYVGNESRKGEIFRSIHTRKIKRFYWRQTSFSSDICPNREFSGIQINNQKNSIFSSSLKKHAKPNKLFPSLKIIMIIMNCDKKRRSRNNSRRLFQGRFGLVLDGMENVTSCTCFAPQRKEENFKLQVCKKHNSLNDSLQPHSVWLLYCASSRSVIN